MATSTAPLTEQPTTSVDIKADNQEFRVYANVDAEGNVIKLGKNSWDYEVVSSSDFDVWEKTRAEKNVKDGKGVTTQLAFSQTVRKYRVATIAGLSLLIEDPEEEANIVNRGIQQKFNQKVNQRLSETDEEGKLTFQPVEGAYDSIDWLQEETRRKNLTPMERTLRDFNKNVANLTSDDASKKAAMDQIAAILASLQQGQ